MHFDRDALAFKALVALDEVAGEAGAEPIEPSYAVRFTLAWLYAAGNGDRDSLDGFFHNMRDPLDWCQSDAQRASLRGTRLRSGLKGTMHILGLKDFSPEFFRALGEARLPKEARARLAAGRRAQLEAHESREAEADGIVAADMQKHAAQRRPHGH